MTNTWEQRKFSDLYKRVTEKNDLSFTNKQVISVAQMYFKSATDIKSDDKYMKTYNIFRVGDIAFEGNKSKNFSYGRFVENTIGDGIVSHVFDVFRPTSVNYDLAYWKYFINNENIMGRILMKSTTKATMMTNLVAKDFLKRSVLTPNIREQHRIGQVLSTLDNLITLHQRIAKMLVNLTQSGQRSHDNINIFIFQFLNNMKIGFLSGRHAGMSQSSSHTSNRNTSKK